MCPSSWWDRPGGQRPETLPTRVVPDCRHLVAIAREYLRQCWRNQGPVDLLPWFSAVPELWHAPLARHLLPVWLQFAWASFGEAATLRELEASRVGGLGEDRIVRLHIRACRIGLAGHGSPRAFRWGRYYLRYLLGCGSHGVLYRGWDPLVQRDVAVKLSETDAAASESVLWSEATLLGRLGWGASLHVYDLSCEEGLVWMVRRFVPGRTLAELIGRGRRSRPGAAVRLIRSLLQQAAALHRWGVVHGDIWPANLLVAKGGACDLVDFCAGSEVGQLPRSNPSAPPEFVAPELRTGIRSSDPRSDVYSLGVVTGKVLADAQGEREGFSGRGSTTHRLMRALTSIRDRALAADPSRRFPTGGAMLAAFRRAACE